MDNDKLTKKERETIKKEQERKELVRKMRMDFLKKWAIISVITALVVWGGWWIITESNKPLPGQSFSAEGRDHVKNGEKVVYKTNPPTSGNHYADWTKPAMYNEPQQDENLVHSLEHGYIIISFNCVAPKQEPKDPAKWTAKECTQLKKQLLDLTSSQRLWKLIVVPRPTMDSRLVLTAWTRSDTLQSFEKDRIVKFIDAYRNKGPEQTME